MGYRQYLHIVDKNIINDIQKIKRDKELYEYFIRNAWEADKEDYNGEVSYYCSLFNLPTVDEFEFGKYYENSDELYELGDPLYTSEELQERYEDFGAIVGGEDMILSAIKWQKNHIVTYYERLINNTYPDEYSKMRSEERFKKEDGFDEQFVHYMRLKEHCEDQLRWWSYGSNTAINLDKNKNELTNAWLYELTIFDLVRIYKAFEPDKHVVLFYGL